MVEMYPPPMTAIESLGFALSKMEDAIDVDSLEPDNRELISTENSVQENTELTKKAMIEGFLD